MHDVPEAPAAAAFTASGAPALLDGLTDVPGLLVGHYTEPRRPTGCTVVLCEPQGAVCGVAQRGGAPGTRETDLLRPENVVERVHAVLLSGGSAFGLDAATGVMRWLEEQGRGLPVGLANRARPIRVPIVPAAVIFDLWVGDSAIRPGAAAGHAACCAAQGGRIAQGSVGAGTGATVGKLFGWARAMRGGIGSASARVGEVTVAALIVANPIGDVRAADGSLLAGARCHPDTLDLVDTEASLLRGNAPSEALRAMQASATTIGVIATDARLNKAEATQLASLAHAGLARAVSPLTPHDGDTFFALATGGAGVPGDLSLLGALAADCVSRAIRHAVLAADSLADPGVPSARARQDRAASASGAGAGAGA
ncbi:MAG: P1 family peptidase [Rubrivivax sp.]|nr:P1 family peptidase [Rubrivivax sp.]